MIDPILIAILATLATGFAGLLLKYAFRSKCTDVNILWGCCRIKRDTDAENEEEKLELEHGVNVFDPPSTSGQIDRSKSLT